MEEFCLGKLEEWLREELKVQGHTTEHNTAKLTLQIKKRLSLRTAEALTRRVGQ